MCGAGGGAKGKYGDAFIYSIHAKAITRQLTCLLLPLFTFLVQGKRLAVKAIRLVNFFRNIVNHTTDAKQKTNYRNETAKSETDLPLCQKRKGRRKRKFAKVNQNKQTKSKKQPNKRRFTWPFGFWIFSPHSLQNKTKKT